MEWGGNEATEAPRGVIMMEGPLFDIRNKAWARSDRAQTALWWAQSEERGVLAQLWVVLGRRVGGRLSGSRAERKAQLAKALRVCATHSAHTRRAELRAKLATNVFLAAEHAALTDWNTRRG